MVKVLANKILAFDRGEKDKDGHVVRVKTVIGFCELPDWVEKTDLFQAAVKEKSLQPFVSSAESEAIQKGQEKLAVLQAQIAVLEERKELLEKDSQEGEKPRRTRNKQE